MKEYLTDKKISVVIPCYNEADNIPVMYKRLTDVFAYITPHYELVFVDNDSRDRSAELYQSLCKQDQRVSAILMSRNFGSSDTSYAAGTEYASGDAVVWIDGDIQDPPEVIPQFVQKWLEGYDIVYGVRSKRKIGALLGFAYKTFYYLFRRYSYIEMPMNAGDFCIIDRRVANALNSLPERDRFMRGLRAWVGFKHIGVEYTRLERAAGRSSTNLGLYIRVAKKGLISFSYAPLTFISNIAFVAMIVTTIAILAFPFFAIFYPAPRGFLTLIVVILFIGSVQFCILAILGEYMAKIFEEVKARPKYIIRTVINNHRA
ncbi:MAG: glycosyltransferase [Candidatus Ryanbacteria bacterium]|nr:glycosyltransferase [Candidatus Ryanbacteria bacterium]